MTSAQVVIVLSVTAVLNMLLLLDINHWSSLLETFTAVLNIHAWCVAVSDDKKVLNH